ncbi:MAG: hypothetical protein LUD12_12180 [Lachnospiraceae bacterium]|nr:hypothetical protein [Lachnospiraceae bacterium]
MRKDENIRPELDFVKKITTSVKTSDFAEKAGTHSEMCKIHGFERGSAETLIFAEFERLRMGKRAYRL